MRLSDLVTLGSRSSSPRLKQWCKNTPLCSVGLCTHSTLSTHSSKRKTKRQQAVTSQSTSEGQARNVTHIHTRVWHTRNLKRHSCQSCRKPEPRYGVANPDPPFISVGPLPCPEKKHQSEKTSLCLRAATIDLFLLAPPPVLCCHNQQ